ncbi:GNAT family N-acetyltransferase [Lysinibacillus fusiformis]|nr:GNAT family N-acetyltransferase [Lysinibacillus fusiformis]
MNNLFTIDCGEILLREFRIEDVDAIYELTSQPEVYEFLPDWRSTRAQRLHWVTNDEIPSNQEFLSAVPHVGAQNYLKLGIILKETGEFIGFCNTGVKEELSEPNQTRKINRNKVFGKICRIYSCSARKIFIIVDKGSRWNGRSS